MSLISLRTFWRRVTKLPCLQRIVDTAEQRVGKLPTIDSRARTLIFPVRGRINRKLYRSSALSKWLSVHIREFDLVDIQGTWAFVNIDAARIATEAGVPYVMTPHGMMTRWDWSKRKLLKRILVQIRN